MVNTTQTDGQNTGKQVQRRVTVKMLTSKTLFQVFFGHSHWDIYFMSLNRLQAETSATMPLYISLTPSFGSEQKLHVH